MSACLPVEERERIQSLLSYEILDTEPEQAYDDLAELAAHICQTPIALISLVDDHRQWFKARVGLVARETHRDLAFCAHTLNDKKLLVVTDALQDPRFCNNPLVTSDPAIRFYAGAPLIARDGHCLGTLCVIDRVSRQLSEAQLRSLRALSRQVVNLLELRHRTKRLEKARASKEKFLALIGRDLKKPFNSLLGFSSVLRHVENLSKEQMAQAAQRIHGSAKSAYDLVMNLLLWSRFELGALEFKPQALQVYDVVDNVVRSLQPQAEDKSITLEYVGDDSISVYADWRMLSLMLRNLADNAIKFSDEGQAVRIDAQETENEVLLEVHDNGIGINGKQLDQLFNIESDNSMEGTEGKKGAGLGVHLCKDFIERHHGRIWVESREGEGTTFFMAFPKPKIRLVSA